MEQNFSSIIECRQNHDALSCDDLDVFQSTINQYEIKNRVFRFPSQNNLDRQFSNSNSFFEKQRIYFETQNSILRELQSQDKLQFHRDGNISAKNFMKKIDINEYKYQRQGDFIDIEDQQSQFQETSEGIIEEAWEVKYRIKPNSEAYLQVKPLEYFLNSSKSTKDTIYRNCSEEIRTQINYIPIISQTFSSYNNSNYKPKEKLEEISTQNSLNSSSQNTILSNNNIGKISIQNEISYQEDQQNIKLKSYEICNFLKKLHPQVIQYLLQNVDQLNNMNFQFNNYPCYQKNQSQVINQLNDILKQYGQEDLNKDKFKSEDYANKSNLYELRSLSILYFITFGQSQYQTSQIKKTKSSFLCACGKINRRSSDFNDHIKKHHPQINKYYLKVNIDQLKGRPKNNNHNSLISNLHQEIANIKKYLLLAQQLQNKS